jgi:hypothetical protein
MSDVDWVLLKKDAVKVGDLVSTDAGGMPIYRVVAIDSDRAWLRLDAKAELQAMPLDHFHWKAANSDEKTVTSTVEVACQSASRGA